MANNQITGNIFVTRDFFLRPRTSKTKGRHKADLVFEVRSGIEPL